MKNTVPGPYDPGTVVLWDDDPGVQITAGSRFLPPNERIFQVTSFYNRQREPVR